jgi:cobalt/nickel transport system permease protein
VSHIHIPDGVLPLWLIAVGWIATACLTALAVRKASNQDLRRRVPLIGAMAALMLVGMSSEIIPIAYHINLTVLAGILLGPWLSIIAALIVNVMLALLGHGGVTVIGLNTLVIVVEMVMGWFLFGRLIRLLGRRRPSLSASVATVLALALSTTMLVGIVALGGSPAAARESGAFDPTTLSFASPFGGGAVTNVIVAPETKPPPAPLPVARFAIMVYLLGSVGWVIEALVTALIVGFVARVRPGLVFDGASAEHARAPLGDEGAHH